MPIYSCRVRARTSLALTPLLPCLVALSDCHRKRMQLISPDHLDWDGLARAISCQDDLQIFRVAHRVPIELDQDVAEQDAALLRRTVLIDLDDQQAIFLLLHAFGTLRGWQLNQLAADAQEAAFDVSLPRQRFGDSGGVLHGDCQR